VHRHPVYPITQDLLLHDQGVEVGVGHWPVADVITYLAWRFEALSLPVGLAEMLHRRTNGNPLFLVTVVDELVRQGGVREGPKGWELYGGLEAVAGWVPERLQQLIERQGEQLTAEEQRLLEVASVAGVEFATATVAVGLGGDVDAVEERCASLAHREQFLRAAGTDVWPDGTITACYGFRHALYQEVFYAHVPARRRAHWHGQMGVRLEAGYGEKAQTVAAALAEHFVQGRETVRAVPYLRCAGDQAMQRSAYQEAIRHLTRALALLPTLPETPERLQQELEIHLTLGPAWMAGKGYTTPEVVATYTRALALSQQHGTLPQRFAVLRVLRRVHTGRAEMPQAHAVGDALLTLAQQCNSTAYLLEAHMGVGTTWLHTGRLERARHHLETALTFYKTAEHRHHAMLYGHEPGVACLAQLSRLLWFQGYPDQARQWRQEALALAQEVAHPYSLDFALLHANWLAHYLREVQTLQAQTETTMRLAHEAGLGIANATLLRGWALVMQGQGTEGIAQLHQGMARQQVLGEALSQPYYAALLAEASQQLGQPEAGVSSVEDALTAVYTHGHHFYTAELHRLQGTLILQAAGSRPASEPARLGDLAQRPAQRAEACLCQALEVARGQQAKSLELRAAMSLARLWQRQGKRTEAHGLLAPIYGWFTEGFDIADLQEAKALLDELGG
jgi:predicted ATPase